MSENSQRPESDTDNSKVYISNINKSIEQEDIRRKFGEFGVIKSLILKKKENNVTYSFIQYEKASEAKAAIAEMDKKIYFDRVLKVEHGKGGHRGLQHYHTNRYDKPRINDPFFRDPQDRSYSKPDQYRKKRSYSYSSDSYDDRPKRRESSRSPYDRYRSGYKPYPDKYRDRSRSRSFERPRYERREYRDDRYKDDDRYRKTYREYPQPRYRDDKYNMYRRERSPERRDYEKDRRKQYREPKDIDRLPKDDRYYKEPDRYLKDDRYGGERYDKYPRPQYKEYRRDGYQRRKEFIGREEVVNERKDSKDYQNYQPRQGYDRRRSGSRDNKPRLEQFPRID